MVMVSGWRPIANVRITLMTQSQSQCKQSQSRTRAQYINTVWEIASYDVWGNARDGYEVNNVFRQSEPVEIRCKVETFNAGTPQEFMGAYPSDSQIRMALG